MTAPARPLARRWTAELGISGSLELYIADAPGTFEDCIPIVRAAVEHNALVAAHEADRALIETLVGALEKIAAFDDKQANEKLATAGSYYGFDEPGSVMIARAALAAAGRK